MIVNPEDRIIDVPDVREMAGLMLDGKSPTQCQKDRVCIACDKPAIQFMDLISLKEYTISTMCQTCQNDTFSKRDWNEL